MPLLPAVPVMLSAGERTTLNKRVRGAKTAHRDRLRGHRHTSRTGPLLQPRLASLLSRYWPVT